MSSFDFNNSDEEWDNCEIPEWGEKEWQDYLKKQTLEVARFVHFYQKLPPSFNRVEETASLMGWEEDSFEEDSNKSSIIEMPSFLDESIDDDDHENTEDSDFSILYTIHQHPVYTITQSILHVLIKKWEHYHSQNPFTVNSHILWVYSQKLNQMDKNVLMALQSLEMGDFALTVCHLKWAINTINEILKELPNIVKNQTTSFTSFMNETKICLFDLRQVWLKVIKECRKEIKQQFDNLD